MAHNLEQVGDMWYVGEKPWHDHGTQVTEFTKEIPAILNWGVETRPIFLEKDVPIPGHVAIVRNDNNRVYGLATDGYIPHQNAQLWETFNNFCSEGNMSIETAGILKGGEIIWILAKVLSANPLSVGSDYDKTNLYALIGSGHNNKLASFTKPTAIRVVCNNTFNVALNSAKLADRQVHKAEFDVKRAADFVNNAILGFTKYGEAANYLASKKVLSPALSLAFSQELLQPENLNKAITVASNGNLDLENTKKEWISEIFSNSAKQQIFTEKLLDKSSRPVKDLLDSIKIERKGGDSWWNDFNGVTRYVDHVRSRTTDTRLYNAWFGSGAVIKQEAFEKAFQYADAA